MVEAEINFKNIIPEHWSLFLRCTICFGYLQDPHTLECGHTFCKRCLKRLGEIAQEDNVDVHVRRLSLSCPTCRHPFPAKPVLNNRICTCIVLKHMVELWKRECKMLASSSLMTLRSTCTQTDSGVDADLHQVKVSDSSYYLQEEFTVRIRPMEQYCQAVMKRVSESTEDSKSTTTRQHRLVYVS
uniref:RING-type domain-containing protein n=1 Tax=Arion vulgaris TaxID=1028688 RepID=A0A0B6ZFR2_9EUPU